MRRKLTGIRGIDGSLLARLRARIKETYGKTKDSNGSITARTINKLIEDSLNVRAAKTEIEKYKQTRDKTDTIGIDIVKQKINPITNPQAVIEVIERITGSRNVRTLNNHINALCRTEYLSNNEAENIRDALCLIYHIRKRKKPQTTIETILPIVYFKGGKR